MNWQRTPLITLFIIWALVQAIVITPSTLSQNPVVEEKGTPAGWTDDIRITDFSNNDVKVAISVDESDVCLAWERTVVVSSDYEVYFVKSNDSGESWDSPQQISNSGIYATKPDINVNNSHLHIVWSDWKTPDWEIFYRNSTDGGETWNPEKRISIDDGNSSEGPRIAVNNSHIHVVWVDARLAQTEVYYKRSTDGGISWDDGLGNPDIDRRITHDLSGAAPAGIGVNASNIHVLFSDDRDGSPDVYYIRSIDNGATWDDGLGNVDEERKLTSNSTWHMASRMAVYGPTIHVVWADQVWPGPVYYLYYRKSTDNGVTWN
ncbi:MAG: exo-alpha-sialidase, partial [Thermoplasmata archaeon]|nr:exo-alpha-sialidase [Thermoplasmata archaeon]